MSKNNSTLSLGFINRCFRCHRSIKSPLPLLSTLFHQPTTLLASPIDQRIYKSLLGLDHMQIFDRWIQTHHLVPIAKPDLVYLQVRNNSRANFRD